MSRRSFNGRRGHGKRGREQSDADARVTSEERYDASSSGPLRQREAYLRMNFLYQAAHLTATGPAACLPLSRFYAATMRKIGTRLTIRSSPPVKSDTCKVCYSLLTPTPAAADGGSERTAAASGVVLRMGQMGSSVSLQASSPAAEPALIRTCRCCGALRRVGLKRQRKQQAAAAPDAQATARQENKPVQQSQTSQTTSVSGPIPQAVHNTPSMPTDADAMR